MKVTARSTERIIQQLQKELEDSFKQKPINQTLREQIEGVIQSLLKNHSKESEKEDFKHFKINVEQSKIDPDTLTLVPMNLWSGLLLQGIFVPYSWVKDLTTYETKYCTFEFKDSKFYFIPHKPIKSIQVNLTLTKEGKILLDDK